ncbi:hypothetical protein [Hydrogenophaga sp.]|uniref:hypothetical protein n=1 Tax=Hydrogenophaga sp. TaxID=1904254 RepID=UPI002722C226|nr:hypothetical protein [Hydrogenophaga sp.]MDO8903532.1 hypothetical protein [Hydrogenophaga sp.]
MAVGLVAIGGAIGAGVYWRRQSDHAVSASEPMSPDMQTAELRADMCTSANAVGVGLRGEYFPGEIGKGTPLLVRIDSPVLFDDSLNWPDNLGKRPRSVRWSGWIKAPLTGTYRFHADAKGLSVSIAQRVVAGAGVSPPVPVDMSVGRFYPILLELSEVGPDMGEIRLEWTAPHGARYLVPRSLLFLPSDTVAEVPRTQ